MTRDDLPDGAGWAVERVELATLYLLERGVRVVGTDAWGWDAPFVYMAERYQQTKDALLH